MSQIMSVDPPLQITFSVSTEKLRTFSDEGENSLLETNSAHTPFCIVKLIHSTVGARGTTHFGREGWL